MIIIAIWDKKCGHSITYYIDTVRYIPELMLYENGQIIRSYRLLLDRLYNKGEVFAVNNMYSDSRYNIIVVITIARAHITYKGNNKFCAYPSSFSFVYLICKSSSVNFR